MRFIAQTSLETGLPNICASRDGRTLEKPFIDRVLVRLKQITIRYTSPHGRQEERSFRSDTAVIDLRMRAALAVDLSELSECNKIEALDISSNLLESIDLSPLQGIQTLRRLQLQDNRLTHLDLWPLVRCRWLDMVDTCSNRLGTLDTTPVFTCREMRIDSPVVLTADSMLKYTASPDGLKRRFHSVRPDHSIWTATPVIIWVDYQQLVRRLGWKAVVGRIRSVLEKTPSRYWFHLQHGLLEGLGMDELAGFDGDPRMLLESAQHEIDSDAALDSIYDRTVELLSEQVKREGPTLFLHVGTMRNTRASKLIPGIIKRRKKEIEAIKVPFFRGRAFLQSLWLTSYGFHLLKALRIGVSTDSRGLEKVKAAVKEMGFELNIERVDSVEHLHWKETSQSHRAFVFSHARGQQQIV